MTNTYTVRYTASYWEQACAGSIYLAAQGDRGRILATGRTYDDAKALARWIGPRAEMVQEPPSPY